MGVIVLYESIWYGLQVNTKAIMEEIAEKTRFYRFFISYDNMNFYEYIRDQQLYNRSAIVNYTARYIYFMKTPEKSREDNTWLKHYIDLTEIDQKLVNTVVNEDFNLI